MKPKSDAPRADALTDADKAGSSTEFKLAEKRADGTAVLQHADGRMFTATLADGVEADDVLKSSTLTVKHDGLADGIPTNPVVTKAERS